MPLVIAGELELKKGQNVLALLDAGVDKHSLAISTATTEGITSPTSLIHMLAKRQAIVAKHFMTSLVSKTGNWRLSDKAAFRRYVQPEQEKLLALPGEAICFGQLNTDLEQASELIFSIVLPFINEDNNVYVLPKEL